jgi:Uma2 family endonuclease
VEKVSMGSYPVGVASILQTHLGVFVDQAKLGRSVTEMLFRIDAGTQYRPDVAFVSDERWSIELREPKKQPWNIVPDLPIEVISETDGAEDILEKTRDYFDAGARAVWLIYPSFELVYVYETFHRIKVVTRNEVLDGGDVIPDFRLPLATLFRGRAPEEDTEDDPAD